MPRCGCAADRARRTDRAWSYPHPYPAAFDRVGADFSGCVAFDPAAQVA